jgi:AcrR family transcriptional regulator
MRADARRNYERIVATARDVFAEHGVEAPLDDIAKSAKVGPGTLYRHFASREALIEAVYREEVGQLASSAYELRDTLPATEALFAWMREQVAFINESGGLALALKTAIDADSETFEYCRVQLNEAVAALLEPAQAAGVIRADLEPRDLLRLGHGIGTAAKYADEAGVERLLSVVLDGLRAT